MLEIFAAFLLVTMLVIVSIGVIWRVFLNSPLVWTVQVAKYLMIWQVFLGSAVGIKFGDHVTIDLITDRLSENVAPYACLVQHLMMMLFSIVILVLSIRYSAGINSRDIILGIDMNWVYASLPVSAIFMILFLVEQLIGDARSVAGLYRGRPQ